MNQYNFTRHAIIRWLEANDANGCYSDEDCMAEIGRKLTLAELAQCIIEVSDDS